MTDLKRDMAILATSGRERAERTKRMGARVPNLDIFSQRLVTREIGGRGSRNTAGAVLASVKAKAVPDVSQEPAERIHEPLPPLLQLLERANGRREHRERRGAARKRARANAS